MIHSVCRLFFLSSLLLLSACASAPLPVTSTATIGPYPSFTGRLIVIEPARRWQTAIDWQADNPDNGRLRLTHAASNTIIEFRWQQGSMRVRDNRNMAWRPISQAELAKRGIVLPPTELATMLLGGLPDTFHQQKPGLWLNSKRTIRLQWYAGSQRLVMTDIAHGRKATLIIQ